MLLLASCKGRIMDELFLPINEKNLPSVALHHLRKYYYIFRQQKRGIKYFLNAMITCAIAVGLDVQVCVWVQKNSCAQKRQI